MSEQLAARPFPRGPLLGAAMLVVGSIALVAFGRVTGIGVMRTAETEPLAMARDLRFEDRPDGAVAVYDANTGLEVDLLEPGSGGFIRGILRSFARSRRAIAPQEGPQPPFRLAQFADGRLSIEDVMTRTVIALDAFGPTNAAAFMRFLNSGEQAR